MSVFLGSLGLAVVAGTGIYFLTRKNRSSYKKHRSSTRSKRGGDALTSTSWSPHTSSMNGGKKSRKSKKSKKSRKH